MQISNEARARKLSERDTEILHLVNDLGWTLDQVGLRMDLDKASVCRVVHGRQNLSGTGKSGPKGPKGKVRVVPLRPGAFFNAANNIIATINSRRHRTRVLYYLEDERALSLIKRLYQAATQLSNEQDRLQEPSVQAEG